MDSKAVYKSAMVLVLQNMDIFMGDISTLEMNMQMGDQ